MIYPLRVTELENTLCNQDKLLCKIFCENKKLNLELESASLRSVHDDMSAKPCDNCKMIMMNYVDMWLVHTQVTSQLKGAKSELRELKAHSSLLGACTSCPMLTFELEASTIEIKELKHKLDHSSQVFYALRVRCVILSRVSFSMLPKRTPS
jgi:Fe-S cluster biogenesis protein NfuA